MASGDVVTHIVDVAAVYLYYQPAASVEIAICSMAAEANRIQVDLYDGALAAYFWRYAGADVPSFANNGNRLFITNTLYLQIWNPATTPATTFAFTGIKVK